MVKGTYMARKPVWSNLNVLTFSLAGFFSDVSQEPALAVLPSFVVSVAGQQMAPLYLGLAMGFSEAFAHIFKLVFGWLSARVSFRKLLVAGGYTVEGAFMACIGLATVGWQIVLFRTVSRIGKGMRTPARDAMLSASVSEEDYGAGFGLQRTADTLGAVVGVALLLWVITLVSERVVFYLALIPALLASAVVMLWAYDPRGELPLTQDWRIMPDIKKLPFQFWTFLCVVATFGVTKVHPVILLLRQYNIASSNGLLASQYAIIVYLCYNIARSFQGFIAGSLGDRFGRELVLACGGYIMFGIAALGMTSHMPTLLISIPLFVLLGMADGTIITLEKSLIAQMVPAYLRDIGYGMLYVVKGFAMLFAGWMVGTLWSVYTAWYALMYIFTMSVIAAAVLAVRHVIFVRQQ